MFRHSIRVALRNLVHDKFFACIKIVGLAVGFSAAIAIGLYVKNQFSYEHFIPGYENIYRVAETFHRAGASPLLVDVTPPGLAAALKAGFPEIVRIARLQRDVGGFASGSSDYAEEFAWADPDFFKTVPLPVFAGDADKALSLPDSLILTRSAARKYFGRDNAIGQTLTLDQKHRLIVRAILEDLPASTHFDLSIIAAGKASYSGLTRAERDTPDADSAYTYLQLKPGANAENIRRALPDFLVRHLGPPPSATNFLALRLFPISEINITPAGLGSAKPPADPGILYALAGIGALILLIAAINFVNLTTAAATQRATEVGLRKALGAARPALIVQYVGEGILYALLALLVALALLELLSPYLNGYLKLGTMLNYWHEPLLLGVIVAIACAVGALAGLYPAFVISAFRPVTALKGLAGGGTGRLRAILVIAQFTVLTLLIAATLTIYRQTNFLLNESLRIDKDGVMLVFGSCSDQFREGLNRLPGVRGVACSMYHSQADTEARRSASATSMIFRRRPVDFGYFELFGLKPLAGRFFSAAYGVDAVREGNSVQPNIVINETAMRRLGFSSPQEALGQSIFWTRTNDGAQPSQIIGVVPDFSMHEFREKTQGQIYFVDTRQSDMVAVKLSGAQLPETLSAIDTLWKRLGTGRPITRRFFDDLIQMQFSDVLLQRSLLGMFSLLAIFIASIGLFALAIFTAERRIKEIGVRKALGAGNAAIVSLLTWQFAKPVLWANLLAWPIAWFVLNRWLDSFAYRIPMSIPLQLILPSLIALGIALLTVSGHAIFIARQKPVSALRYE